MSEKNALIEKVNFDIKQIFDKNKTDSENNFHDYAIISLFEFNFFSLFIKKNIQCQISKIIRQRVPFKVFLNEECIKGLESPSR